jgi:hypothetical protein
MRMVYGENPDDQCTWREHATGSKRLQKLPSKPVHFQPPAMPIIPGKKPFFEQAETGG